MLIRSRGCKWRIHELFRGSSLRRNYYYRPTLSEPRMRQLEEPASAMAYRKAASLIDECDMKERQKLYDQRRQARDQALQEHQASPQEDSWTSGRM